MQNVLAFGIDDGVVVGTCFSSFSINCRSHGQRVFQHANDMRRTAAANNDPAIGYRYAAHFSVSCKSGTDYVSATPVLTWVGFNRKQLFIKW